MTLNGYIYQPLKLKIGDDNLQTDKDEKTKPGESVITYVEGQKSRVLRGKIIEETDEYIRVERNDGIQKVFRTHIVTIKEPNEPGERD